MIIYIYIYEHLKLIYCCCFDLSVFQWEALSKRLWKLARWPNSKVWAEMEYKLHYSMDWCIAKVTGNHVFSYSKWKFPLRFSLQHSINSEGNSAESIRIYISMCHSLPFEDKIWYSFWVFTTWNSAWKEVARDLKLCWIFVTYQGGSCDELISKAIVGLWINIHGIPDSPHTKIASKWMLIHVDPLNTVCSSRYIGHLKAISLAKAGSIFNITIAKDCKTAKVSSLNSMPCLKSITRALPGQCARLSLKHWKWTVPLLTIPQLQVLPSGKHTKSYWKWPFIIMYSLFSN